jgi:hypothetical protein
MTAPHIAPARTPAEIDTIIDVLDREARTEIDQVFSSANASCMTCTRAILDVLAAFAVPARPLTVWATVTNAAYEHMLNPADGQSVQELGLPRPWSDAGAFRIDIGHPQDRAKPGDEGWPGHLVALVDERVALDFAIDMANAPSAGIMLTSAIFPVPPEWLTGTMELAGDVGNATVRYRARPDITTYTVHPHWMRLHPPALTARIVSKVRRLTGLSPVVAVR